MSQAWAPPAARRSPVPLLVCLLALATGFALLEVARFVAVPDAAPAAPGVAADVGLVRRFYDAANAVLRTGDATHIDPFVAPDLIEHPTRAPGEAGRTGLAQALLSRRAAFPDLRLVVDDARVSGDQVAVRVHAEGAAGGSFLGLAVPESLAAWGPLDLVRIAGGRIVERWGSQPDAARFMPLWQSAASIDTGGSTSIVAFRRLTWEPGAELNLADNPATWFLVVETGTLTVTAIPASTLAGDATAVRRGDMAAAAPETIGPGRTTTIHPGDLFSVPAGTEITLRNDGTLPAGALGVALWAPTPRPSDRAPTPGELAVEHRAAELGLTPGTGGALRLAPGVEVRVLTTAVGVDIPPTTRLALGRVVLAPGGTLALPGAVTPLVVMVEAGLSDLTVSPDHVWATDQDGRQLPRAETVPVAVGEGALLTPGATGTWRAEGDEPFVALVLAMDQ